MLAPVITVSFFSYLNIISSFILNHPCLTKKVNFNDLLIDLVEIYILIMNNSQYCILICIYGEVYPSIASTSRFSSL